MPPPARLTGDPEAVAHTILETHGRTPAWIDRFIAALDRGRSGGEFDRILTVWGLTKADAARLFGVSRQAVAKWTTSGVPLDRLQAVGDLAAATDLLVHYLKRDRIPAV